MHECAVCSSIVFCWAVTTQPATLLKFDSHYGYRKSEFFMFPSALVLSLKRILILVTRRNMTYLRKFFFFFFFKFIKTLKGAKIQEQEKHLLKSSADISTTLSEANLKDYEQRKGGTAF